MRKEDVWTISDEELEIEIGKRIAKFIDSVITREGMSKRIVSQLSGIAFDNFEKKIENGTFTPYEILRLSEILDLH